MTPPEYQGQDAQAIQELVTMGVAQPFEKEYVRKDGRRVSVLVGIVSFRKEGSRQLVISFVLDLTARKEIERRKDLFLSMTSHELKTPLAALKGTLQLAERRIKRLNITTAQVPPRSTPLFPHSPRTWQQRSARWRRKLA